jgi:hypothetical protein
MDKREAEKLAGHPLPDRLEVVERAGGPVRVSVFATGTWTLAEMRRFATLNKRLAPPPERSKP